MDKGRRIRLTHLSPLTKLTTGALLNRIQTMPRRSAEALLRAMGTCSDTNCGWDEYAIAKRYLGDVAARIVLTTK